MYDNLYLHGFEDSEAVSALWLLFFLCCISAHVCVVSRPFRWAVGRWLRVQCSVIGGSAQLKGVGWWWCVEKDGRGRGGCTLGRWLLTCGNSACFFFVVFTSPQIMQKIIPRKPLGSVHHAFSETEEMDSERGTTRNQLWTVHC